MRCNTPRTVNDLSITECRAAAYYLYRLCLGNTDIHKYEAYQILLKKLVYRVNRVDHFKNVLWAFTLNLVEQGFLTPFKAKRNHVHPFDYNLKIDEHFIEDREIYANSGAFKTASLVDIYLCRVIFSAKEDNFARLIAYTFFPENIPEDDEIEVGDTITVPNHILKAVRDTKKAGFLRKMFHLSAEESVLLLTACQMQTVKELYYVHDALLAEDESPTSILAKCLNKSVKDVRSLLRPSEKLATYALMQTTGILEENTAECIFTGDTDILFTDIIKEYKIDTAFEPDSYSIKKESCDLAVGLLQNNTPAHILLYGSSGTGKTEFAKTLAVQSGLKTCIYKNEADLDTQRFEQTAIGRLNAFLSIQKKDSVIIIDEAEAVLKTAIDTEYSLPQKGPVNQMLENNVNKVIWILNYTDLIDNSTLRRFTYSIKFGAMPKSVLKSIADSELKKINIEHELRTQLVELCSQYYITGSSVGNMMKTLTQNRDFSGKETKIIADVKNVLEANSALLYGSAKIRESVQGEYDLTVLNTSVPAEKIVSMVQNAVRYAEKNPHRQKGIRMLFYGMSGTGKTELARYIAETLQKKLILKRASDILAKYAGESETKIKNAFEEASSSDSVLLFDEADTFFADRASAQRSWERTMVNEFLTQMDTFDGIVICTTNLRSLMDPAMQRRFHIMTEFKALTGEGVERLLLLYFTEYTFERDKIARLTGYGSVTPGDFAALAGRIRFMDEGDISADYITDELIKMQEEKNTEKPIGFVCR